MGGMEELHEATTDGQPAARPAGHDRSTWPVWIGRVGGPQPKADYSRFTPSERIELCWEATKQAWALTGAPLDESAFCRDAESVSRRAG
jgi:hypothetical protein